MSEAIAPCDDIAIDPAAERAWRLRYASPARMALLVEGLAPGPGRQVLLAFQAWRAQRYEDTAELTATIGDDPGVPHRWRARALNVRSGLFTGLGQIRESFEIRQRALEQARLAHDRVEEISSVHGFGVLLEESDPYRAQQQYLQTLLLIDAAGDAVGAERRELDGLRAAAVINLHGLFDDRGLAVPDQAPRLEDLCASAWAAWPEMGAVITARMAMSALDAGDLETASALARACPDPRSMRDVALSSTVAVLQARVLTARGEVREAARLLEEVSERLPPWNLPETLEELMRVHEAADDVRAAYAVARRLLQANREVQLATTAHAVRALEVIYRTRQAEDEARRAAREARRATETLDQVQEESTRDALTGVRNRRYLMGVSGQMLTSAGSALAVVDIDDFKGINDRLGHRAGDLVLRRVAQTLSDATHPEDVVARLGGDEFVVLRPAGGEESLAADLAGLATMTIPDAPQADETISLSIGVAGTRADWDTTFPLADHAMYEAKRAGGRSVRRAPSAR